MRYYFGLGFHMLSVIRPQKVKFLSDGGHWNKILSNGGLFLCQFRGLKTVHRDTTWLNVHLRSSVKVRVNTEELQPAYFLQECSTTHSIHYFWLLSLPIRPLCPVDSTWAAPFPVLMPIAARPAFSSDTSTFPSLLVSSLANRSLYVLEPSSAHWQSVKNSFLTTWYMVETRLKTLGLQSLTHTHTQTEQCCGKHTQRPIPVAGTSGLEQCGSSLLF